MDEVVAASNTENDDPGQLLGYRALHKKPREQHGLAVPHVFLPQLNMINPRGLVDDVMRWNVLRGWNVGRILEERKEREAQLAHSLYWYV